MMSKIEVITDEYGTSAGIKTVNTIALTALQLSGLMGASRGTLMMKNSFLILLKILKGS